MIAPQASARSKTGMPLARASTISGFSSRTAAVRTTNWMSGATFMALWPILTSMPRERRCSVFSLSAMSEPSITRPMPARTSASGAMLTPPTPIKCPRMPGLR